MYCNAITTRLLVGRLTPAIRATWSAPVAGSAGRFSAPGPQREREMPQRHPPLGPGRHRRRAYAKRMPGIKGFQLVPSTSSLDRINASGLAFGGCLRRSGGQFPGCRFLCSPAPHARTFEKAGRRSGALCGTRLAFLGASLPFAMAFAAVAFFFAGFFSDFCELAAFVEVLFAVFEGAKIQLIAAVTSSIGAIPSTARSSPLSR